MSNRVSHIHRGDTVVVTKGRERGKRGKVKRVLKNGRIEVEKVLMVKKHTRPTQKNPQGGIKDIEGSINVSNLALWCDSCSAPRRARSATKDNQKVRACVKCGATFANPGM